MPEAWHGFPAFAIHNSGFASARSAAVVLPVLALGISTHAQGLGLRRVHPHLAVAVRMMLPSALTIARGLATAANHPLRTKSEESIEHLTNIYLHEDGVEKRVFQKLEFSAGSRETRGNASCRYTDATSRDSATLLQQREVSGTIWTDTKAHADSALEEIIAALFGAGINRPTRIATTDHRERWGNPTQTSSPKKAKRPSTPHFPGPA